MGTGEDRKGEGGGQVKFKVQSSKFKILRKTFGLLSSKTFLIWVAGGWIVYYVMSAIWMKEAFSAFASGVASTSRLSRRSPVRALVATLNAAP